MAGAIAEAKGRMQPGQEPLPGAAHPPGLPVLGGALGPVFGGCSSGLADATVHPLDHTVHQPCLLQTCEKHTILSFLHSVMLGLKSSMC